MRKAFNSINKRKKEILIVICTISIASCSFFSLLSLHATWYNKELKHEISDEKILDFPEGFLWGAATASYQVEGGNYNSSWWDFEQLEGSIKNGESAEYAVNHYDMYSSDIDLMKDLNLNSYRFSIEWSRIEPEKGEFDDTEIEHYSDVIQKLRKEGIEPMVTLLHHSVPKWFEDEGGFKSSRSVEYFSEYVQYVVSALGEEVSLWITINEPMAYITCGYISGKWPPGQMDLKAVPFVFANLVRSHKRAYGVIHTYDHDAEVGIAEHTSHVVPAGEKNFAENIAVMVIDKVWNHHMIEEILDELDFIGIHYYYKQTISTKLAFEALNNDPEDFESRSMERSYYPQGLYELLIEFSSYGKAIYITELGVQDYHQIERDKFIKDHLIEVYYAIKDGADVRGFYYWTLLDCFEWSEGYEPKFGLYEVDRSDMKRILKEKSEVYAEIAKCNCVEN